VEAFEQARLYEKHVEAAAPRKKKPSVGSALISCDSGTLGAESPARATVRL